MDPQHAPTDPIPILNAYWQSCVLLAAVDLQLPQALARGPVTVHDITRNSHLDAEGVERILRVLAAWGWVDHTDEEWRFSETGRRFLHPDSPDCVLGIVRHHLRLMPKWTHLADFVRGIRPESAAPSGDAHDDFLHGMRDMAQKSLPHLLPAIDLSGRTKLLDLGGGPGTYAIHFCRQWQQLQAIVFDQPQSQRIAEKEIAAADLTDRISFMGGDLFTSTLPEDCDVIWLSHILHMFSEAQVRELLRKVTERLAVPGLLIIHDFFLNDDACSPLFPTLFNINMYLNTAEGRSYQASQIRSILEDMGYVHIEHIPIPNLNSSLITASLPKRSS